MQTSLGGRALRASRLWEVWLPWVRDCLETAHLRAVPFPLVTLGSLAITGPCLVALTRPACLSWVLWHGGPYEEATASAGCGTALGSHPTFPCRAVSAHHSLTPGNNPHAHGVQSPNLLLISPALIWIRNSVIL